MRIQWIFAYSTIFTKAIIAQLSSQESETCSNLIAQNLNLKLKIFNHQVETKITDIEEKLNQCSNELKSVRSNSANEEYQYKLLKQDITAYKSANDKRLEKLEAAFEREIRSSTDFSADLEANGWTKINSDVSDSLYYKVVTSKCTWQQAFIECRNLDAQATLAQTLTNSELMQAYSAFQPEISENNYLHVAAFNGKDPHSNANNFVWVISGRRVDPKMVKLSNQDGVLMISNFANGLMGFGDSDFKDELAYMCEIRR